MRIHHLNCISTCPLGGKLMDGGAESIVHRGHLTNHCLLIETDSRLILVDTGLGLKDVQQPRTRLSAFFLNLLAPDFREEMTAVRQIEALGFDRRDVREIVLTHLDFDHAGGLDDFPEARVHMLLKERDSAVQQKTWLDQQRYRPQQWGSRDRWLTYQAGEGGSWFGFGRVHELMGVPDDIVMVPLVGHTLGHAGIAVRDGERWLLQAGDAYFFHAEMQSQNHWCTPGLSAYQTMMEKDRTSRLWNQDRLRHLKQDHSTQIELFCSHDLHEFEKLSGRSAEVPLAGRQNKPDLNFDVSPFI